MLREVIEWHEVSEQLPDVDITVMVHAPDCDEPVWLGWYDGATWFAVDASELRAVDRWAHIPTGEAQRQLFGGPA